MTMTKEEIIDRLKARNPATKEFVERGLSREHLLSPEEQKKVFGFYTELYSIEKAGANVPELIIDFLVETYNIDRALAAFFAKSNADLSLRFFKSIKDDGTFEDADDIIKASMMLSYWDLLSSIMFITGYETLN